MFKKILILGIILGIMVGVFYGEEIYYHYAGKSCWDYFSESIEAEVIEDITVDQVMLSQDEKDLLIAELFNSKYYKSNHRGEGMTGVSMVLYLSDQQCVYFDYWGGGLMETRYKGEQFIVENEVIGRVLGRKGLF